MKYFLLLIGLCIIPIVYADCTTTPLSTKDSLKYDGTNWVFSSNTSCTYNVVSHEVTTSCNTTACHYNQLPVIDMIENQTHRGVIGRLYPSGSNNLNSTWDAFARNKSNSITNNTVFGFVSIGVSNTQREFGEWKSIAQGKYNASVNQNITWVNGARASCGSECWIYENSTGLQPWLDLNLSVANAGLTASQVQAIWYKMPERESTGSFNTYLERQSADNEVIIKKLVSYYPNLKVIYLSSRIYGGYANTNLTPEPYAYDNAFVIKNVIDDYHNGLLGFTTPTLVWGCYLWADGNISNSLGEHYELNDFDDDGTHPKDGVGDVKVAEYLHSCFMTSNYTGWYRK